MNCESNKKSCVGKKILAGLAAVSAFIITIIMSNPLHFSESAIERRLLKDTPVSTDMDSVIKTLKNNETLKSNENYEIMFISYEHGFGMNKSEPSDAAVSYGQEEIGKKSIKVCLGEYRGIFSVDVIAYYGFNEENELIDIEVAKEYEAI